MSIRSARKTRSSIFIPMFPRTIVASVFICVRAALRVGRFIGKPRKKRILSWSPARPTKKFALYAQTLQRYGVDLMWLLVLLLFVDILLLCVQTLVLCSQCPRSFCSNCLVAVLSKNRYAEIMANSQADWTCMCCHFSLNRNPPLSRNAWKLVQFNRAAVAQAKRAINIPISTKPAISASPISRVEPATSKDESSNVILCSSILS